MVFHSEIIHRQKFLIESGCHTSDVMIIVLEGSFTCTIQGNVQTVKQNDICIFHKDGYFTRHVLQKIRCVYIQFEQFPIPLPSGVLHTSDSIRTENTIHYLAQSVADGDSARSEHYLWDIFYLHKPRASTHAPKDPMITMCLERLNSGYPDRITLDDLAKYFSVSKQSLIRKFKRQTGRTPMEHLAFVRINQSKLLLRDSPLSVSEIATACGFENVYYFSNFFKKFTGISPSQYRNRVNL